MDQHEKAKIAISKLQNIGNLSIYEPPPGKSQIHFTIRLGKVFLRQENTRWFPCPHWKSIIRDYAEWI